MTSRRRKDSLIAAAVTLAAVILLLLLLLFGSVTYSLPDMAQDSTPEIGLLPEDEETFVEPELLRDMGEPDAVKHDAPAPNVKGDPARDVKDNTRKVVKGENPRPAPAEDKRVTSRRESKVKATEPSVTDEEKKRVTSSVAKGFEGKNGVRDGKSGANGSGGTGAGISGVASGRVFKGCPKPQVELRHKVTVRVAVVIDASGRVTSARARGGASADIRRACEAAARAAKWSAKPDAPSTSGTITFTITPR